MGRPGKAKPKAKAPTAAALAKAAANAIFVWAQCDNAGCQKWRKLPPGTKIDENNPWFCYMNPDEDWARCSKSEEYYNKEVEAGLEVSSLWPPQSAAEVPQPARRPAPKRGRDEGMSTRHRAAKARPKGRVSGGALSDDDDDYDPEAEGPADVLPNTAKRRKRAAEPDSDELELSDDDDWAHRPAAREAAREAAQDLPSTSGQAAGQDPHARAAAKWRTGAKAQKARQSFEKLLAGGGEWEVSKGRGKAVTALPGFVWEALWAHHPQSAQVAADAADTASAAQYFQTGAPRSEGAQNGHLLAQLALASAAATALEQIPPTALQQASALPQRGGHNASQRQQQQAVQALPPAQQHSSERLQPPATASSRLPGPASAQQGPAAASQGPAQAVQPAQSHARLLPHLYQHPHSASHHRPPDAVPALPASDPAAAPLPEPQQQLQSQPRPGLQQLQGSSLHPAGQRSLQPPPAAASQQLPPAHAGMPPAEQPPQDSRPPADLPSAQPGWQVPSFTGSAMLRAAQALSAAAQGSAPDPHRQLYSSQAAQNGVGPHGYQAAQGSAQTAVQQLDQHGPQAGQNPAVGARGLNDGCLQSDEEDYPGEAGSIMSHALHPAMHAEHAAPNGHQDQAKPVQDLQASLPHLLGSGKLAAGDQTRAEQKQQQLPNGHGQHGGLVQDSSWH